MRTVDPSNELSSPYRTDSMPLFEQSATRLVERLETDTNEIARRMTDEARELAVAFARWSREAPRSDARIAAIQALLTLNRRAMDYLASRAHE